MAAQGTGGLIAGSSWPEWLPGGFSSQRCAEECDSSQCETPGVGEESGRMVQARGGKWHRARWNHR